MLIFVGILSLIVCASSAPPIEDYILLDEQLNKEVAEVSGVDNRIVGGNAVNILNYPFLASLQFLSSHICGATIVNERWAVTAAHCLSGLSPAALSVRTGSTFHALGGDLNPLNTVIIHESFNPVSLNNDIGLIEPVVPFDISNELISPIPLARAGSYPTTGHSGVVAGWGTTEEGGQFLSPYLQAATIPIVSIASCRASYGTNVITDQMVCAGFSSGGRDACSGDSGGPLIVNGQLAGVISWGLGCAQPHFYGVSISIGQHRTWIDSHID